MAARRCPKCSHDLRPIDHEGVTADYCRACGGLWLDAGELEKLQKAGASVFGGLLKVFLKD